MNRTNETAGYEASDASVSQVGVGVAILFVGLVFSLVVAALVYRGGSVPLLRNDVKTSFKHGPENDSSIVRDWREQDTLVREHLESYAWVDRERRLVRVPIERAMDLMIAHDAEKPAPKKP